ncbi:MAG: radical SAM protein [Thermoanaerobaculia bacterium]
MTSDCNHHCPSCTYRFARNSSALSMQQVESLLEQARGLGILAVVFTGGGEPLLNQHTVEAIAIGKRLGMEVGLITNGSRIRASDASVIARDCTWCRVSLDASEAKDFGKAHGTRRFEWEVVVAGIQDLVSARRSEGAKLTVGLGYLVDDKTVAGVPAAIELAAAWSVDYLQLRPFRGATFDISRWIGEYRAAAGDTGVEVFCSEGRCQSMDRPRAYQRCRAPQFNVVVGSDFKVYACCEMKYRGEAVLGDLSQATLADVWGGTLRAAKDGNIYPSCPHPCRHNANNILLHDIEAETIHKNFI